MPFSIRISRSIFPSFSINRQIGTIWPKLGRKIN
jgi:hypothetical protein